MTKFKLDPQVKKYLLGVVDRLENGEDVHVWKKFKSEYREMDAFYHTKLGVVLKNPRLILEPRTPLILRVPTISLGDGWVVQPIARKTNLKAAVEAIKTKLKPYSDKGICPDLHCGNVGWYDGKPVMFDW